MAVVQVPYDQLIGDKAIYRLFRYFGRTYAIWKTATGSWTLVGEVRNSGVEGKALMVTVNRS